MTRTLLSRVTATRDRNANRNGGREWYVRTNERTNADIHVGEMNSYRDLSAPSPRPSPTDARRTMRGMTPEEPDTPQPDEPDTPRPDRPDRDRDPDQE